MQQQDIIRYNPYQNKENIDCLQTFNVLDEPWRQYTLQPQGGAYCAQGQCGWYWTSTPPNRYLAGPVQKVFRVEQGPCSDGYMSHLFKKSSGLKLRNMKGEYPQGVNVRKQPIPKYDDIYYPLPDSSKSLIGQRNIKQNPYY